MAERTIDGKVEYWSKIDTGEKKDGSMWAKISLKLCDDPEKHSFFAGAADELAELSDKAPMGSEVQFIEWKKDDDQFWNFKKGSFVIIEIGDGKPPVSVQKKLGPVLKDKNDNSLRAQALGMAVQLLCHDKIIDTDLWRKADELLGYILKGE